MKLLVVEDQEHVLRLERMVLVTDGFDVETASGGREALKKVKSTRYDAIVLDIVMPDIDGWEVLRQLRSDALNRRTPVILVTASLEPGLRPRAFEAGAAAFLNKPFTADAFRLVIHSAIAPPRPPHVASIPPAPSVPARQRAAPDSRTPTPTWRRPRPAVGQIKVRAETGGTYACEPDPRGGWRCGRCDVGLITAERDVPPIGSRCTICEAEVIETGRERRRWWPF